MHQIPNNQEELKSYSRKLQSSIISIRVVRGHLERKKSRNYYASLRFFWSCSIHNLYMLIRFLASYKLPLLLEIPTPRILKRDTCILKTASLPNYGYIIIFDDKLVILLHIHLPLYEHSALGSLRLLQIWAYLKSSDLIGYMHIYLYFNITRPYVDLEKGIAHEYCLL